ncbi:MAG: DNA polymerase IV [Planctomycetota bacterium]
MAASGEVTILHVDMDVLRVGGDPRQPLARGAAGLRGRARLRAGVISAASYEARKYGVHSAMPTAVARRKCPNLVLLPPDFDRYTQVSRQIMGIFRRYTPNVEPLSLDEAFLDIDGSQRLFGDAVEIGRSIKRDILRETGLVASVGVAPSKFLAKLASDLDKPDGFRVILPDEVRTVLDPLPVGKIFGVGPATAKRLAAMGVETVGQLAAQERDVVAERFGAAGLWIHDLAHGIDPRRVTPRREEKSHGMERTFPKDIADRDELAILLLSFCEEVAFELRHRGLRGRTVTLKARFGDFTTVTRSRTLEFATNLGPRLYSVARELLRQVPAGPLRLLGVQVSKLEDVRTPVQGTLFDDGPGSRALWLASQERIERATASADQVREKYGKGALVPASLLGRKVGKGTPRPRDVDGEADSPPQVETPEEPA